MIIYSIILTEQCGLLTECHLNIAEFCSSNLNNSQSIISVMSTNILISTTFMCVTFCLCVLYGIIQFNNLLSTGSEKYLWKVLYMVCTHNFNINISSCILLSTLSYLNSRNLNAIIEPSNAQKQSKHYMNSVNTINIKAYTEFLSISYEIHITIIRITCSILLRFIFNYKIMYSSGRQSVNLFG